MNRISESQISLPLASVLILTRNRADSLERALQAVRALNYPRYEIVVVDNDSTDHTKDVILKYGAKRILVPSNFGIGYCRRKGVESAAGTIIAFCDDDCVPYPDWLSHFVRRLQQETDLGILGGQVINIGFRDSMQNKGQSRHWKNGKLRWTDNPMEAEFYGNMNLAFRKEIVERIGNYDPFFNVMEEIDLQARIRKAGYRVAYEPNAVLEHHYTGISQKRRHTYGGSQLIRLYFCMKYYRPKGLVQWMSFTRCEISLFWADLKRILKGLGSSVLRWNFKRLPEIWKSFFQSVSARLAIPWLILRANRNEPLSL